MTEIQRILVPLDGSELAEKALPLATLLADKFNSELVLLRVLEIAVPSEEARYPESHWIREALQYNFREAQNYLNTWCTQLTKQGIRARTLVRDGPPPEDILEAVTNEKIDMVVISSHGKGSPSPWTSGSVADKVMQHCPCPVLLVRQNVESR
jgi:nucleotide-binding universal stress UspA family protein